MSFGARPGELPERLSDAGPGPHTDLSTWSEREHEGGGDLLDAEVYEVPLEGPEHDIIDGHELRKRLDEVWEQAFRCGRKVSRDERRAEREVRDEKQAHRDWIFQLALLATIAVVTLCTTYVLTH